MNLSKKYEGVMNQSMTFDKGTTQFDTFPVDEISHANTIDYQLNEQRVEAGIALEQNDGWRLHKLFDAQNGAHCKDKAIPDYSYENS